MLWRETPYLILASMQSKGKESNGKLLNAIANRWDHDMLIADCLKFVQNFHVFFSICQPLSPNTYLLQTSNIRTWAANPTSYNPSDTLHCIHNVANAEISLRILRAISDQDHNISFHMIPLSPTCTCVEKLGNAIKAPSNSCDLEKRPPKRIITIPSFVGQCGGHIL